ncbi:MAG TPA: HAD family hydrolase [Candidatus Aquilonibacter sp.]|jgi:sugar-phosphatase|nr:HAD family hydrolase [Candidatus Aquilonibacter sp.]
MPTFRCSAILFDLDGVLVDSTGSVDLHWRVWARERGIDEEKVIAIAHGVRAIEVIRIVAPHLDADAELRDLEKEEANDHHKLAAMPGAIELVRSIPENLWCVVTSGTRHLATERLRMVGVPVPKAMITADDVVNGKPYPEPYLKGAKALGFEPQECLVIEDAPAGIRAAHAAGMKVIGFASTYEPEQLAEADAVIRNFSQLSVVYEGNSMHVRSDHLGE